MSNTIHVEVTLGLTKRKVMIDTGCTLNLMDLSFFNDNYPRETLVKLNTPIPLTIGDGSNQMSCTHYGVLPITFLSKNGADVLCYQTFYIAAPRLHDQVILGHRFFKDNHEFGADLSYVKQCIYFNGNEIPWADDKSEELIPVKAAYDQSLPPQSISIVATEVPSHTRPYCGNFGIFTLRTCYSNPNKILKDGCDSYFGRLEEVTQLWLSNPSTKWQHIRKGHVVAHYYPELEEDLSVVALYQDSLLLDLEEDLGNTRDRCTDEPHISVTTTSIQSRANNKKIALCRAAQDPTSSLRVLTVRSTSDAISTSLASLETLMTGSRCTNQLVMKPIDHRFRESTRNHQSSRVESLTQLPATNLLPLLKQRTSSLCGETGIIWSATNQRTPMNITNVQDAPADNTNFNSAQSGVQMTEIRYIRDDPEVPTTVSDELTEYTSTWEVRNIQQDTERRKEACTGQLSNVLPNCVDPKVPSSRCDDNVGISSSLDYEIQIGKSFVNAMLSVSSAPGEAQSLHSTGYAGKTSVMLNDIDPLLMDQVLPLMTTHASAPRKLPSSKPTLDPTDHEVRNISFEIWQKILASNERQKLKAQAMSPEDIEAFRITNKNRLLSEATIREICSMPDSTDFEIPDYYDCTGHLDRNRLPSFAKDIKLDLLEVAIDRKMCNRTLFEILVMNPNIQHVLTDITPGYVSPDYFKFEVELTNQTPWNEHLLPMSPEDKMDLREVIERNLKLGLIEACTGPYASRCLLVKKANGRHQIASCLQTLNSRTRKNTYPLPLISDNLDILSSQQYRSSIDVSGAYLSLPLPEEVRDWFAFITHFGLYRWKRLPYGFKNAGAIFCGLMDKVTGGLKFQTLISYCDDLISTGLAQAAAHVKSVNMCLYRIFFSGLKISIVKLLLFRKVLPYLGFEVSDAGLQPSPSNIEKLARISITDAKSARSFLGLAGYYRRWIKDFSQKTDPIRALTLTTARKKDYEKPEIIEAIELIKQHLLSAPILKHPDFEKQFCLATDASRKGFGFVLMQLHNGLWCAVRYGSCSLPKLKSLNVNDSNLLEVAAASWAVSKNRVYLRQIFILRTDAQIMEFLNKKNLSDHLMLYAVQLQAYDYVLERISGKANFGPDLMTRAICDDEPPEEEQFQTLRYLKVQTRAENKSAPVNIEADSSSEIISDIVEPSPAPSLETQSDAFKFEETDINCILSYELWVRMQAEDPALASIKESVRLGESTSSNYFILNDLLFRKPKEGKTDPRVVVPKSLYSTVVKNTHLYLGHRGQDTVIKMLCSRVYFEGMVDYIREKLKSCVECSRRAPNFNKRSGKTRRVFALNPMDFLCIDFMGPLPLSREGFRYLLVVICVFTRYPWAIPLCDMTADTVAQALMDNVFSLFGLPFVVHSDNQSELVGRALRDVFRSLGIRRTSTTTHNPNGNSPVERFIRYLNNSISLAIEKYSEWPAALPAILFAYRCTPSSFGYSPCYLMTGRDPTLPLEVTLLPTPEQMQGMEPSIEDVDSYVFDMNSKLKSMFQNVRELQERRSKQHADRRDEDQKRTEVKYNAGDLVGYFEPKAVGNRLDFKGRSEYDKSLKHAREAWTWKWSGPHTIVEATTNPNVYCVNHNSRGPLHLNVNKLKIWPTPSAGEFISNVARFKPPFADLPRPFTQPQQDEIIAVYVPEAAGRCRVGKVINVLAHTQEIIIQWFGYFLHTKVLEDVLAEHRWEPLWIHTDGLTYAKSHPLHPLHLRHTNEDFPKIRITFEDIILRNIILKPNGTLSKMQASSANRNLMALIHERGHEQYYPPQAAPMFKTNRKRKELDEPISITITEDEPISTAIAGTAIRKKFWHRNQTTSHRSQTTSKRAYTPSLSPILESLPESLPLRLQGYYPSRFEPTIRAYH